MALEHAANTISLPRYQILHAARGERKTQIQQLIFTTLLLAVGIVLVLVEVVVWRFSEVNNVSTLS